MMTDKLNIERIPEWETALNDVIVNNHDLPHVWGEWDCILWACTACEAMTGCDPAADFRGKYDDQIGAMKALRDIGDGTLVKTVDARFDRKPTSKAQRGDWVMVDDAIGVCVGATALFVGEERLGSVDGAILRHGFIELPRDLFEVAWSI